MKVKAEQVIKLEIHAAWFIYFLKNSMLYFIPLRFIQANPNPVVIFSDHRMHDDSNRTKARQRNKHDHVCVTSQGQECNMYTNDRQCDSN